MSRAGLVSSSGHVFWKPVPVPMPDVLYFEEVTGGGVLTGYAIELADGTVKRGELVPNIMTGLGVLPGLRLAGLVE